MKNKMPDIINSNNTFSGIKPNSIQFIVLENDIHHTTHGRVVHYTSSVKRKRRVIYYRVHWLTDELKIVM